jgi:hypothetical protein
MKMENPIDEIVLTGTSFPALSARLRELTQRIERSI